MPNPVILNSTIDAHKGSCRLDSIIWVGNTTPGDSVELSSMAGDILWKGQTDTANTYLPHFFNGLSADGGFKLTHYVSGQVLVYLDEDCE